MRRTHANDIVVDCARLSLARRRAREESDDALSSARKARFVLPFSLVDESKETSNLGLHEIP